jgi:cytochrome c biogenesis protein CcdA/thioredoxin-related protein
MMKYIFVAIIVCLFGSVYAQDSSTTSLLKWNVSSKKIAEKKYSLTFTSTVGEVYQLYAPAQDLGGSLSAEINFNDSSIAVDSFSSLSTTTTITSAIFDNKKLQISPAGKVQWQCIVTFKNTVPATLIGSLTAYLNKGDEFLPDLPFAFNTNLEGGIASGVSIKDNAINLNQSTSNCGDEGTANKSIATIFLLGFLGGLIALITPCVFPMIPVTVTFFTKKSQTKAKGITNAVLYGLFIFLIYIAITIPFHVASKTLSPEIFNNISTNVWLNLIFFAIFVFFALSFFGLYEIGLPSSIANKADSKSGLGNIAGIFFMASTLAIVSFSCTGPILGTLLANVADQGPWPLTAGAAGFGVALGLPFALFALFPQWLQSLPKSGGWMTDVKVVLGFIELALAVKFLANADNVMQWGILKREIFVALWVIIGALIVLFLLGKISIGHASPVKKFSAIRLFFIVIFGGATLYLLPGLTNSKYANLGAFSGFPPPLSYTIYTNHVLITNGIQPIHNQYEKALEQARAENKPLLIDFTGWACVNCRRMEEKVWTNKEVDSIMRTKYVVLSLYVDEKTKLPTTEQTVYTTSAGTKKSIITVGDRWATFQTENFGATSQPQYGIINANKKALTKTKFYTPDPNEFKKWLQCGLDAFELEKNK